jgi:benzoylformate decarboxylase
VISKTGAELVRAFLDNYDVKYVFGNPGTTETTFLAALAGSDVTYMLSLHESSAVGIAAGHALISKTPAVVSLHTYPGLANGMFNMRNALMSGIPLLVVNGTEDSRFLIHNPPLAGPNTDLAATATKYQYEVRSIDEVALAFQRCYVQAALQPTGPVFLSIPMDFMQSSTAATEFRKTTILDDAATNSIDKLAELLRSVPAGKLAIIADYAVGWHHSARAVSLISTALGADLWAAPFHVQGVVDTLHPNFQGQIPLTTGAVRSILERYDTILLLGEKLDTFTWIDAPAVPASLRIVQVSPATDQLGFDWPVDVAVVGEVRATLDALTRALAINSETTTVATRKPDYAALEAKYPDSGDQPSNAIILRILRHLDPETHIITEGSSEDATVQSMATALGYRNVHFSPRGGGLGWAMPLTVGNALATGKPQVCFVGDGGSLFSIHAIWTAAAHKIPAVFICFVNAEYRLLKQLWVNFAGGSIATTNFVGLDFDEPPIDIGTIACGFGAKVVQLQATDEVPAVIDAALRHPGPTFITIKRAR